MKKTVKTAWQAAWFVLRIYIPVSIITYALKMIGIIDFLSPFLAPVMDLMGLPGESALPFVAGMLNGVSASMGSAMVLNMTARQLTILAIVTGTCHALIMENAILMKLRMATIRIAGLRFVMAVLAGILLNVVLPKNIPGVVMNPFIRPEMGIYQTIVSLLLGALELTAFIFLATLLFEYVERLDWSWLKINKLSRVFGFDKKQAIFPFLTGYLVGIGYGAGMLFSLDKKHKISKRDKRMIASFWIFGHAVIQDSFLYAFIGANFWIVFVMRSVLGFISLRITGMKLLQKHLHHVGL